MLKQHSILHALFKRYLCSALAAAGLLLAGNASWAQSTEPALRLLSSVEIPVTDGNTTNGMFSFDISFVDQATGDYFLADRSNLAVEHVSAESIVTQIRPTGAHPPFAGFTPCGTGDGNPPMPGANDCAGPNGVVAAFPWLFVTDAPSRVLSFDLRFNPPQTVSECTTMAGDPTRTDELAYDPKDGLILAINNVQFPGHPPYGTLITVNKTTGALTCGTHIPFTAANGVDAQNGAEQPVWDPGTQKVL